MSTGAVSGPTGPARRTVPWSALVHRPGFSRILLAGVISTGGFGIATLCTTWLVFSETRSALDIAYLGAASTIAATVFGVVGGVWADRYDRRYVMVGSDLGRAAASGALVASIVVLGFHFVALLVASSVTAALTTVFQPAEQSIVPSFVGREELADANGLLSATQLVVGLVASAVGGIVVVTVGAVAGLGVSVVTFVASASLLVRLPAAAATVEAATKRAGTSLRRFLGDVREGFAWLARRAGLLGLTFGALAFNLFSVLALSFLVFYSAVTLHGSALTFAGLLIATSLGGAIGALLVGRTRAVARAGVAFGVTYGLLAGASLVLLAAFPTFPVAAVGAFVIGASVAFAGNVWLTYTQLVVPSEVRGRYYGVDMLGSVALVPLAQVVGGVLVTALGVRTTYLFDGIAWTLAGTAFLAFPVVRSLGTRA